jgi:hypothetical protein
VTNKQYCHSCILLALYIIYTLKLCDRTGCVSHDLVLQNLILLPNQDAFHAMSVWQFMTECVCFNNRKVKWASSDVYVWVSESLLLLACTAHVAVMTHEYL